jgi:hypothetical protein
VRVANPHYARVEWTLNTSTVLILRRDELIIITSIRAKKFGLCLGFQVIAVSCVVLSLYTHRFVCQLT